METNNPDHNENSSLPPSTAIGKWIEIQSLGSTYRGILKHADEQSASIAEENAETLRVFSDGTIDEWKVIEFIPFDSGRSKFYLLGEIVEIQIRDTPNAKPRFLQGILKQVPKFNEPGYISIEGETPWRGPSNKVTSIAYVAKPKTGGQ